GHSEGESQQPRPRRLGSPGEPFLLSWRLREPVQVAGRDEEGDGVEREDFDDRGDEDRTAALGSLRTRGTVDRGVVERRTGHGGSLLIGQGDPGGAKLHLGRTG